jgi:hypothetical protein
MKKLLIIALISLLNSLFVDLVGQTLEMPKYEVELDLEPLKPFFLELDAPRLLKTSFNNGRFKLVNEKKSEFDKRNIQYKKELYRKYVNSENYKKWEAEHLTWKEKNPNWKEITRYPELLTEAERRLLKLPKPVMGEDYIVQSVSLNIRAEADKTSEILVNLKKGQKVKLISVYDENWWWVEFGDVHGYAFTEFLKLDPYSGWKTTDYRSGNTPECENVTPEYDYNLDNHLTINVGSNTDVVVKLMKTSYSEECIRIVYVRNNESFDIKNIPEGQYFLKIAYGKDYRQKIVDNKCFVKFMVDAEYKKGSEILTFSKIQEPDIVIGNTIRKRWKIKSYSVFLDVQNVSANIYSSNEISEAEFNK